jgi:uncharacterized membrane protein YfcA
VEKIFTGGIFMYKSLSFKVAIAGIAAGSINGLFGAAGGMVLIPLLTLLTDLKEEELFSSSLAIMLPICLVALAVTALHQPLPLAASMPYLAGSGLGGLLAGILRNRIPTLWLHRLLGLLIIWGGVRYLW